MHSSFMSSLVYAVLFGDALLSFKVFHSKMTSQGSSLNLSNNLKGKYDNRYNDYVLRIK